MSSSDSDSSSSSNSSSAHTIPPDAAPINVYDFGSVRQKIDKNIRNVLFDQEQYEEDLTTSNVKILLGLIACGSAIAAYFKNDATLVMILCAIYVVLGVLVQLVAMYIEKSTIFLSKVKTISSSNSSSHPSVSHVIRAEVHIAFENDRDCPDYTLKIVSLKPSNHLIKRYLLNDEAQTGSVTWKLNELLDEFGTLDVAKLTKDVQLALQSAIEQQNKKKQ